MDVTTIVADIASMGDDIETIGIAIIAVAVIVLSITWVKAQFF